MSSIIGRLASGEAVVDRTPSHVHGGVTPALLAEALARVSATPGEEKVKATVAFGRVIGACNRVETRPGDEIVFAQRIHREGPSRFVKNRAPEPTSELTFTVRFRPDGTYQLQTAYLGGPGHVEPWAARPERYREAVAFWNRNALCYGHEPVVPGTEQAESPWDVTSLVYGSARFAGTVTNNVNRAWAGPYDRPTKLVDARKDVALCLSGDPGAWGLYPTHQEAWLSLAFVAACHARHEDVAGHALRLAAWEAIPAAQWPALAAKAYAFAEEFRTRLAENGFGARKAFKSATRALQDCLLYATVREFPEDQDAFLASSPVAELVARANQGRAGALSAAEGLALADEIDAIVASLVAEFGGIDACRQALVELQGDTRPGRVIILPEGMTLERASALVRVDVVIGIPDAHDMDLVSVVVGQGAPELVQLKDQLSGQRLDIMAVAPGLGAGDHLTGGHPAFQSVGEMLLANGTPRTPEGRALLARLAREVDPRALAQKYRVVAQDFWGGKHRKSWAGRRSDPTVVQVKKVIPLYRIVCDLLPRAAYMERTGSFPGGQDMASLADQSGLGREYRAIKAILDRQDATDEELEAIAAAIEAHLI